MFKVFLRYCFELPYFFFNLFPYKIRKKITNYLVYKINVEKKDGKFIYFPNHVTNKKKLILDVGSFDGRSIDDFLYNNSNVIIHAFEPNPSLFLKLKKKYKDNKKVILNQIALGDVNSYKTFYLNFFEETSSLKMLNKSRNRQDNNHTKKIIRVKCMTLEKYLKIKKIKKIDLLKLDTQGNEYLILKGAKKILAKGLINFIKLELIFEDYYTKSTKFYEIEKNFIKSNYKLISLEDLKYSADTKILQLDAIYKIK